MKVSFNPKRKGKQKSDYTFYKLISEKKRKNLQDVAKVTIPVVNIVLSDMEKYICDLIFKCSKFNYDNVKRFFVEISSVKLQEINSGYSKYINNLVNNKIIEVDHNFTKERNCKGYRFLNHFAFSTDTITDTTILSKLYNQDINLKKTHKDKFKKKKHILELEKNIIATDIIYEDAIYDINNFDYQRIIENNKQENIWKEIIHKYKMPMTAEGLKSYYINSVNSINDKDDIRPQISQDDYGRVHSKITRLKRELKNHLRYKGEKLFELDIANSQPFLLNLLIKEYLEKHIKPIDIYNKQKEIIIRKSKSNKKSNKSNIINLFPFQFECFSKSNLYQLFSSIISNLNSLIPSKCKYSISNHCHDLISSISFNLLSSLNISFYNAISNNRNKSSYELIFTNNQYHIIHYILNMTKSNYCNIIVLDILNLEDINHYLNLTINGNFWTYLQNNYNAPDYDKFKAKLFEKIFYGKVPAKKTPKERKLFSNEFPFVLDIIDFYKSEGKHNKTENKDTFKNLAREMQRKESDIIIETIAKKLTKEKIFILTIHDSIVCLKKDADYVKNTMKEAFERKYKLVPTIKFKELEKPGLF